MVSIFFSFLLSFFSFFLPYLLSHSPIHTNHSTLQLEYSIYVGAIAVMLLNFSSSSAPPGGGGPGSPAFLVSAIFTLLALLSLAYSTGIYLHRSRAIRTRRASARYHDRWGATALCGALLAAVALNFAVEGRRREIW